MADVSPFACASAACTVEAVAVIVTGLQIPAEIGVYAHERGRTQILSVDVTVEIVPPQDDALVSSLDYIQIADDALALGREPTGLIETYARRLAERCIRHPSALRAQVRVSKPGALRNGLAATCVTLSRGRDWTRFP